MCVYSTVSNFMICAYKYLWLIVMFICISLKKLKKVLLSDPRPETSLEKLLLDKKRLVADRIKAVQEQETSKAQAKTEQMKKEIQRTREVQDAQRTKELAIISQQKEVEIARQV